MSHTLTGIKAGLLHDGGHALTAIGVAYLVLVALNAFGVPQHASLLWAGWIGFLLPAGIQEYLDYRHYGLSLDSIHDVPTYAPILGVNYLLRGQVAIGLLVLFLVAVVEVVYYRITPKGS